MMSWCNLSSFLSATTTQSARSPDRRSCLPASTDNVDMFEGCSSIKTGLKVDDVLK